MPEDGLRKDEVIELDHGTERARLERVLFINLVLQSVFMIDIYDSKAREHSVRFDTLMTALVTGAAIRAEDPYEYLRLPGADFSEARQKEKNRRAQAMSVLTRARPELQFDPRERGKLIRQICDKERKDAPALDKATAYILWRRFLQRGQIDNAFLGDHDRAGWTTEQRCAARPEIVEIKNTMFAIATMYHESAVEGKYLSWPKACELGRQHFFNRGVTFNNDRVAIYDMPDLSEMPTNNRIKREYYSRKHFGETVQARTPENRFNQTLRALNEDQRQIAYGAMDVQQGDFYELPIYVVDPVTREVIGKPTLGGIRDTMCRARTASAVTWERDGGPAVMLTIENLVCNKVEYGKSLNVTIEPEWMPYEDIGDTLLTDNGGFITKFALQLWDGLRLELLHTGKCRPEMKPIAESSFVILYNDLIKLLPGAVPPDAGEPDCDPVAKRAWERATMDINQLRRLIFCHDVSYNRWHYLKDYPLTDDMKGRVRPIPNELYRFSERRRVGKPRRVAMDVVRMHCLKRDVATVTRAGIEYAGRTYISQRAKDEHWQEKVASLRHSWDIDVLADPRTASRIFHILPNHVRLLAERRPFLEPCWITRSLGERTDIAFADLAHEQSRQKAEYRDAMEDAPRQAAWLNGYISDTVEQAGASTCAALGGRKQERGDFQQKWLSARAQERSEPGQIPASVASLVNTTSAPIIEGVIEQMTTYEYAKLMERMTRT